MKRPYLGITLNCDMFQYKTLLAQYSGEAFPMAKKDDKDRPDKQDSWTAFVESWMERSKPAERPLTEVPGPSVANADPQILRWAISADPKGFSRGDELYVQKAERILKDDRKTSLPDRYITVEKELVERAWDALFRQMGRFPTSDYNVALETIVAAARTVRDVATTYENQVADSYRNLFPGKSPDGLEYLSMFSEIVAELLRQRDTILALEASVRDYYAGLWPDKYDSKMPASEMFKDLMAELAEHRERVERSHVDFDFDVLLARDEPPHRKRMTLDDND